jgi:hypothetical protein
MKSTGLPVNAYDLSAFPEENTGRGNISLD